MPSRGGLVLTRKKRERVIIFDPLNPDRKVELTIERVHKGDGEGAVELRFSDPDHHFKVLRGELVAGGVR